MHVAEYLGLVHESEQSLADGLRTVANHHRAEPDIVQTCQLLAAWSEAHVAALAPIVARYCEQRDDEPEDLSADLFRGPRTGPMGLIRDLHDLWLLAYEVKLCWTVLNQAAQALRDVELETLCTELTAQTERQAECWLSLGKLLTLLLCHHVCRSPVRTRVLYFLAWNMQQIEWVLTIPKMLWR